jgi:hypothetical protein
MKKLITFTLFLVLFGFKSNAQLTISQYDYTLYADTVIANTLDSADVWIVNAGSLPFLDNLKVILDVQDSAMVSFHNVDSLNFGFFNIPANDSVKIRLYQNFVISPQKYHYDINVIVIWPYAFSTGDGDSLILPVYIQIPDGINEIDLSKYIKAYPNPSVDKVVIDVEIDIEEVRIYDLKGQLIFVQKNSKIVNVENLPEGSYLFDVTLKNGTKRKVKIIKK